MHILMVWAMQDGSYYESSGCAKNHDLRITTGSAKEGNGVKHKWSTQKSNNVAVLPDFIHEPI